MSEIVPVPTIVALAARLGVHRSTAQAWLRAGAPRRPDGAFDVAAVAAWRDERDRAAAGGADREHWRTRRERAAALRSEAALAQERGELIPRAERDADLLAVVQSFVSALENLPPRVVPLLVAARGHQEIDTILRDHVRTLRIQLAAKHAPRPPEETASEADGEVTR